MNERGNRRAAWALSERSNGFSAVIETVPRSNMPLPFYLTKNIRMKAMLPFPWRRRMVMAGVALLTISACKANPMTVTLDVVYFNYLNRPIFDAFVDGKAGDRASAYPATGGSTITGVRLALGPKRVTWRLDGPAGSPRLGETVTARNQPALLEVPGDAVFLGVHIYPDETVELIPTHHYPRMTEKGEAMARAAKP
ncbi:hypothetical protein [Massilia sp. DD77]|uniref:hypothetical protein n=1 Tax=Massilia sp. DD77 TaxID=3109349 RepID=UPI003000D679